MTTIDKNLFHFFYDLSLDHPMAGTSMVYITLLSSRVFGLIFAGILLRLLWKKDQNALPCFLGPFLSSMLVVFIRLLYTRPRPFNLLDIDSLIFHESTGSLPSMHATASFAIATAIGILYPKARIPAFLLAALTALSRVMVGVHFPSDILLGALLACLVTFAVFQAFHHFSDTRNPAKKTFRHSEGF